MGTDEHGDDDEVVVIVCHWCRVDTTHDVWWAPHTLSEVPEPLRATVGDVIEILVPVCADHFAFQVSVEHDIHLLSAS